MKRTARYSALVLALTFMSPALPQAAEAQGPDKITINHKGRMITVSLRALPAHLRHGDTHSHDPGCPPNCPF